MKYFNTSLIAIALLSSGSAFANPVTCKEVLKAALSTVTAATSSINQGAQSLSAASAFLASASDTLRATSCNEACADSLGSVSQTVGGQANDARDDYRSFIQQLSNLEGLAIDCI
jgi:hypothetical protein